MQMQCNKHILKAFDMARKLIILADEGEADCKDNGCVVLYGRIRDCAYSIRKEAERERDAHIERGTWEDNVPEA